MRLVRSNDDPRLIADLERLAGVEASAVDDGREGGTGVAAPRTPLDDPFVRRFVQGSVHLRKYAPFYVGAGLWMLAMLVIQPIGSGSSRVDEVAQPTGVRRADIAPAASIIPQAEPDAVASPVFFSAGASSFSSDDVYGTSDFSDFADPEPSPTFAFEPAPTFDEPTDDFASSSDTPAAPKPLSIVFSGYTSATGGTLLEQDPGGGTLPVWAAAGNDEKRSFITLAGDETVLRLKEAASGNVNAGGAAIKACPITAVGWTPSRGKALNSGPAYDNGCVTGTRAATGVWSFDLAGFGPLGATNGFALVPASGTALTFQVTFEPKVAAAA
ncbi:MAG TPA: hypothetical protein VM143_07395 [Acidimicrobiales bacterium]|nr:hypothetical protein [Acidimicrobiales bacterium]